MSAKQKKVLVAMSGGVDSSVAATLLKNQGYQVSGVFLRLWKSNKKGYNQDKKNLQDVKKIAQQLGIDLKILDVRKEFKNEVVKYFLETYKNGATPNPCVFCNKHLKFKVLLKETLKQAADFLATGHYAQIKREFSSKINRNRYQLYEAIDKEKDQSYFLYSLNQKELAKIIFPLGELKKGDVRRMAKEINLAVSEKKESQDVCFLAGEETESFLKKNIKAKKGEIINDRGEIIGQHQGLAFYTLGQRKGIGIGGEGPYYVTAKNYAKNRLEVASQKKPKKEFYLEKANWINKKPAIKKKILLRTRYHNPLISAIIEKDKNLIKVNLAKPQKAITPGQSAVFYDKEGMVLGGSVIKFKKNV